MTTSNEPRTQRKPMPRSVKHEDLLAATQPLFDLLEVDAGEVYSFDVTGDAVVIELCERIHPARLQGLTALHTIVGDPEGDGEYSIKVTIPTDLA